MKLRLLTALVCSACAALGAPVTGPSSQDWKSVRIDQTVNPIFPAALRNQQILRGEARIVISVDATGQLADWLVVGYTHPEFADAALEAIRRWKFEPMQLRGEARAAQVELRLKFEKTGVVVTLDLPAYVEMRREELFGTTAAFRPRTLKELDAIPTPIEWVRPAYGEDHAARGLRGEAVVAFFIDEKGAVRMPSLVSADHEELGVLAVEALHAWRFEPATVKGRPVLVRVQQTFRFVP